MKIDLEYRLFDDLEFLLEAEKLDIETLSKRTSISKKLFYDIKNKQKETKLNCERIYSYMYSIGYRLNKIKEEFLKESNKMILFHGSKFGLNEIKIDGSRTTCDFGNGFYLGESFDNAASFVCENDDSCVYSFELDLTGLKVLKMDCSLDWMLAICYYRKTIKEYENSKYLLNVIARIEDADVIIAPIADNRMFYVMSQFANGDINSNIALHSLSASFMGHQYVLKSSKAIAKLKTIERYYLCELEKNFYIEALNRRADEIETKLKMAKREFRDGKYIEELL